MSDVIMLLIEKAGEITPKSVEAVGIECDVTSEPSVKQAFQALSNKWKIDCVVASAGERACAHTRQQVL
jgi:hypothetical protein